MNYHIRSLAELVENYNLFSKAGARNIESKLRDRTLNGRDIIEVLKYIETRFEKKQVTNSPTKWPYIENVFEGDQRLDKISDLVSIVLTSRNNLIRGNSELKLGQVKLTGIEMIIVLSNLYNVNGEDETLIHFFKDS